MSARAMVLAAMLLAGCGAAPAAPARLPDLVLQGTDGRPHRIADEVAGARATVITFFSATCPCQRAHDERLRELYARYRARGVGLLVVDSEATSTLAADAAEARTRAYPVPILSDPDGALADALGARYATYTVVLDGAGRARYSGAIDSDQHVLHPDASLWARDAVDRLLAGREPEVPNHEALGCSLRRR